MTITVTTQLLAAATWATNRIDLMAIGSDSQMYHHSWTPSGWQEGGWDSRGGAFASVAPTLVPWSSDRLDAFGLDKTSHRMIYNSWNGHSWEDGWSPLYDQTFQGPLVQPVLPLGLETELFGCLDHTLVRSDVRDV